MILYVTPMTQTGSVCLHLDGPTYIQAHLARYTAKLFQKCDDQDSLMMTVI